MTAAEVFLRLDRAGLSVSAHGSRLVLKPDTLLTTELRTLARDHSAGLLTLARDAEDRAALVVETARRTAGEIRRPHPAGGGRP